MKVLTALVLLAGVVLGWIALRTDSPSREVRARTLAPTEAVPNALSGAIPAGHVARVFDVEGMCCRGCPRTLYDKVVVLDGVVEVAASFDEGTISAVVPADLPVETLTAAFESEKYVATLRH